MDQLQVSSIKEFNTDSDPRFLIVESEEQILVSARRLYERLGIKKRFSEWFKTNSYGFIENEDFLGCTCKSAPNQNGITQDLQDYKMTLDMSKHICMMSRTETGKRIRQLFIQLEKDWNDPNKVMARALKLADKKLAEFGKQIEEMKPKVLFADAVSTSHTSILVGDLAKLLKQNGVDIGQKRLFEWLRENGYLIKRQGADWNSPTQRSMEAGLFEIKETVISHSDGHTSISKTTKVTGKGQQYFVNKFLGGID